MENKISILSTRKLLSTQKQFLLDAGFELVEIDFIQTESIPFKSKSSPDFLIFTSQNAVKSVVQNKDLAVLKLKKCFCVGQKTKELLEENDFEVIHFTECAEELATYISVCYSKNYFTFFSGNLRRETLPEALSKNKIIFNEIEVYQTNLKPQKLNLKPDGILFFSPSAIESYLIKNEIKNEICFCIGKTTAEALKDKTNNIKIASQSLVNNVIEEVIKYYK